MEKMEKMEKMKKREILENWIVEALKAHSGRAKVIDVCKHVWGNHEAEIKQSEELLYTWQYDVRWAAQQLRDSGAMKPVYGSKAKPWELT